MMRDYIQGFKTGKLIEVIKKKVKRFTFQSDKIIDSITNDLKAIKDFSGSPKQCQKHRFFKDRGCLNHTPLSPVCSQCLKTNPCCKNVHQISLSIYKEEEQRKTQTINSSLKQLAKKTIDCEISPKLYMLKELMDKIFKIYFDFVELKQDIQNLNKQISDQKNQYLSYFQSIHDKVRNLKQTQRRIGSLQFKDEILEDVKCKIQNAEKSLDYSLLNIGQKYESKIVKLINCFNQILMCLSVKDERMLNTSIALKKYKGLYDYQKIKSCLTLHQIICQAKISGQWQVPLTEFYWKSEHLKKHSMQTPMSEQTLSLPSESSRKLSQQSLFSKKQQKWDKQIDVLEASQKQKVNESDIQLHELSRLQIKIKELQFQNQKLRVSEQELKDQIGLNCEMINNSSNMATKDLTGMESSNANSQFYHTTKEQLDGIISKFTKQIQVLNIKLAEKDFEKNHAKVELRLQKQLTMKFQSESRELQFQYEDIERKYTQLLKQFEILKGDNIVFKEQNLTSKALNQENISVIKILTEELQIVKKENAQLVMMNKVLEIQKQNHLSEGKIIEKELQQLKKEMSQYKSSIQYYKSQFSKKQQSLQKLSTEVSYYSKKSSDFEEILSTKASNQSMFSFWSKLLSLQQKLWLTNEVKFKTSKEISKFELIFVASQHKFESESFHFNCDNSPNLLTIIRIGNGMTVGGFSDLQIGSQLPSEKAFIFNVSRKVAMPIKKGRTATVKQSTYGPIFGTESDIRVNSNKIFSNYHIPISSYEKVKIEGTEPQQIFLGGTENTVIQYEVFKIIFK